jgi:hypothetical protein
MQSVDGLWTVEGTSADGGILVLCRGRVLGGGNRYYAVGTYTLRGGTIEIEARAYHFHGPAHSPLAGTRPDFHLHFRGQVLTELIEGHVDRTEDRAVRVPFKLIWRAPLEA